MRRLSAIDRKQRLASAAIATARRSHRYARTAGVGEVVADLAVLRAVSVAAEKRRRLCAWLMGGFAVAGVAAWVLSHGDAAIVSAGCAVAFVAMLLTRVLTVPAPLERLDAASDLVRALDAP